MKRKKGPSTDPASPNTDPAAPKKRQRKAGKPEHAKYLQRVSSAEALDPASKEHTAAFNAFVRAGHKALGKDLLLKLLQGMSVPLPAAPQAVLDRRAERDARLAGINFEPHAGLGLLQDSEVRFGPHLRPMTMHRPQLTATSRACRYGSCSTSRGSASTTRSTCSRSTRSSGPPSRLRTVRSVSAARPARLHARCLSPLPARRPRSAAAPRTRSPQPSHRWRRGGATQGRPPVELLGRPSQPAVVRVCHGHPADGRRAGPAGRPDRPVLRRPEHQLVRRVRHPADSLVRGAVRYLPRGLVQDAANRLGGGRSAWTTGVHGAPVAALQSHNAAWHTPPSLSHMRTLPCHRPMSSRALCSARSSCTCSA